MNHFDWSIIRNPRFRSRLRIPDDYLDDALQNAYLKLARHEHITPQLLAKTAKNCFLDSVKSDRRRSDREKRRLNGNSRNSNDSFGNNSRHEEYRPSDCPEAYSTLGYRGRQWEKLIREHDKDSPSFRIQRRETRAVIKRAIRDARLPEDQRCALWAWFRGRVPHFATKRGIPQVTVRVWVHRAINALRPHSEHADSMPV